MRSFRIVRLVSRLVELSPFINRGHQGDTNPARSFVFAARVSRFQGHHDFREDYLFLDVLEVERRLQGFVQPDPPGVAPRPTREVLVEQNVRPSGEVVLDQELVRVDGEEVFVREKLSRARVLRFVSPQLELAQLFRAHQILHAPDLDLLASQTHLCSAEILVERDLRGVELGSRLGT